MSHIEFMILFIFELFILGAELCNLCKEEDKYE